MKKNYWYEFKDACYRLYLWIRSLFVTRYKIHVSYDNQWGNDDDKVFYDVKKIQKQNFKELKFIDGAGAQIVIRAASGLKYKIEEM